VEVGNLDNWSGGNTRSPMWPLSQNDGSTEPCRRESYFVSQPGLADPKTSLNTQGRTSVSRGATSSMTTSVGSFRHFLS
jgi:hypothetical protein